jgi:hypothetical protein
MCPEVKETKGNAIVLRIECRRVMPDAHLYEKSLVEDVFALTRD